MTKSVLVIEIDYHLEGGRDAALRLLDRATTAPAIMRVETQLVIRQSTGPCNTTVRSVT